MFIDPAALATITAAVSALGSEYLKGIGGEAGKSTWGAVKSLFGWTSDPHPAEIPEKVANSLTATPGLAEEILQVLKDNASTSAMVGKIEATGGKVFVVHTMSATTINIG